MSLHVTTCHYTPADNGTICHYTTCCYTVTSYVTYALPQFFAISSFQALPESHLFLAPIPPIYTPPQAPQCGLLASPDLTLGLLEAVERGQTSTEEVNTFLDRALSRAMEEYPTVQVIPGSLHWGIELAMLLSL